jgi:phage repressor protein C with HTH and peptisase S24 domain
MTKSKYSKQADSKSEIAYRVRIAIATTGLKTPEFARRCGLIRQTLWSWENGKTEFEQTSAIRLVKALSQLNVECTPQWLFTGEGEPPHLKKSLKATAQETPLFSDSTLSMFEETKFFRSTNPNHIVVGVSDDSMSPLYENGDYVGAIMLSNENLKEACNQYCIVSLGKRGTLIRKLMRGNARGKFNLYAINMQSSAKDLVLLNVDVESVAVIIWHRRNFSI